MNKYCVEENVNNKAVIIDIVKEKSLQDKISDHYLDHYHKKIIPFLSSYIKFTSKAQMSKRYLNVGERIKIFRQFSDSFIDFNLWKKNYIDFFHSNKTRKLIMNNLMNELSGKVIRVVDKHFSIFMTDQEIRNSVQLRFKNHVSYKIIKNINASFWKNVYDSLCKNLSKDVNNSYDL